jgi:hypothetical protein
MQATNDLSNIIEDECYDAFLIMGDEVIFQFRAIAFPDVGLWEITSLN